MELPLVGTQLQNQSRCGACRRRLPSERCDSSAEPALAFRTIKATRLSVANYNTTLSSESLETGTGGSNSLRSANQSLRTDNELLLIVTLVGAHSANPFSLGGCDVAADRGSTVGPAAANQ
jgi:hypothetical protein